MEGGGSGGLQPLLHSSSWKGGQSPTQHPASALAACFVFLSAGNAQFGPNKSLHSEPHIGTIREFVNASVGEKKNQQNNLVPV